jgi:hypothetical protein
MISRVFIIASLLVAGAVHAAPVRLIFDTDMATDCDDAGAMAVLHALADNGECEILATVVSSKNVWSAPAVEVLNTYYGRPHIPIGMLKGPGAQVESKYARKLAEEFPHKLKSGDDAPDALAVYRGILEKEADQSVVVVTVGYLANVANLLKSPGGAELARKKVKLWVCMGGNFIGSPAKDDLKLGNVNFQRDASAAHYAIHNWPGEIVFVGREVASVPSGVEIGESLAKTPENNPVRRAYFHYFGGLKNRHVADLASVLYAVRGPTDCWDITGKGYMDLKADMTFEWKADASRKQTYLLKKKVNGKVNDEYVERVLDELLVQAPKRGGK